MSRGEGLSVRGLLREGWARGFRHYRGFLAGFAGMVAVWLFVEWVVILSPLAGNRLVWWVMHVGYFFLTSIPESALLRIADEAARDRVPGSNLLPDLVTVVRYTLLKFMLLPAFVLGLGLLLWPGLWLGGRFLFSGFCAVVESRPVVESLRRSAALTRGRTGGHMRLVGTLSVINLLGLALLGVGLLVTLPLSYVAAARAYRQALTG